VKIESVRYAELERMHVENINIPTGNLFTLFGSFATESMDIIEFSESIFRSLLVKTFFDVTCDFIRTVEETMAQYFRCYC
jgi:hypothetical protein